MLERITQVERHRLRGVDSAVGRRGEVAAFISFDFGARAEDKRSSWASG